MKKSIFTLPVAVVVFIPSMSLGLKGQARQEASFQNSVQPFLAKNCYACHSQKIKMADLNLELLHDSASAGKRPELLDKIVEKLTTGKMPPAGRPAVSKTDVATVTAWIDDLLNGNREPEPGRVTARRLNRVEYNNTIRDLLGVP